MTTKEQERKALAQIRKIVEGLGEGSYIGMAFEGCFEIAEENIENDFGCSMKQRAEAAEKKAATLELDNRDLRIAINRTKAEASNTETALKTTIERLQKAALNPDDLVDFGQMLEDEIAKRDEIIKHEAETIVELADTPNDIAFLNAVNIHRNAKTDKKYYEDMLFRVQRAGEAANA